MASIYGITPKVEQVVVERSNGVRRAAGVVVNGQRIGARAVVSNASLVTTVERLVGRRCARSGVRRRGAQSAGQQLELPGVPRDQEGRIDSGHRRSVLRFERS